MIIGLIEYILLWNMFHACDKNISICRIRFRIWCHVLRHLYQTRWRPQQPEQGSIRLHAVYVGSCHIIKITAGETHWPWHLILLNAAWHDAHTQRNKYTHTHTESNNNNRHVNTLGTHTHLLAWLFRLQTNSFISPNLL